VKFIRVNPHAKSGAWSDADKQAVALWLYPGPDGRQQREELIAGRTFNLCSLHFRDYMLVPRGPGWALGVRPDGTLCLPGDQAYLEAEDLKRGQTRLARPAPARLPVDPNGVVASATASLLDESLRVQEDAQAQIAALRADVSTLRCALRIACRGSPSYSYPSATQARSHRHTECADARAESNARSTGDGGFGEGPGLRTGGEAGVCGGQHGRSRTTPETRQRALP
jgi:hypothetical protein